VFCQCDGTGLFCVTAIGLEACGVTNSTGVSLRDSNTTGIVGM
jgi:hypothetical protein